MTLCGIPAGSGRISDVALIVLLSLVSTKAKDFCSTESFHPRCPDGSVIVVTSARYGRMRLGRCIRVDFGFIGCSSDVLPILDRICSGRSECKLRVPDGELDATNPCLGDLTRYLEASYECIAVQTIGSDSCDGRRLPTKLPLPQPSGYLLGPPTLSTAAGQPAGGHHACARIITALVGQKINLTLYDFSTDQAVQGGQASQVAPPGLISVPVWATGVTCRRLALVTDIVAKTDVDICSSPSRRVSHAFTTAGHAVEIRLLRDDASAGRHFFIYYEVIGCHDLELSSMYWMKTSDSGDVTVGCVGLMSTRTWQLTCRNRTWTGSVGNCTEDMSTETLMSMSVTRTILHDEMQGLPPSLPTGFAVAIIVVIAICVGLCVAAAGIVSLKTCRQMLARQEAQSVISTLQSADGLPLKSFISTSGGCQKRHNHLLPTSDTVRHDAVWCATPAVTENCGSDGSIPVRDRLFHYCACDLANYYVTGDGVHNHIGKMATAAHKLDNRLSMSGTGGTNHCFHGDDNIIAEDPDMTTTRSYSTISPRHRLVSVASTREDALGNEKSATIDHSRIGSNRQHPVVVAMCGSDDAAVCLYNDVIRHAYATTANSRGSSPNDCCHQDVTTATLQRPNEQGHANAHAQCHESVNETFYGGGSVLDRPRYYASSPPPLYCDSAATASLPSRSSSTLQRFAVESPGQRTASETFVIERDAIAASDFNSTDGRAITGDVDPCLGDIGCPEVSGRKNDVATSRSDKNMVDDVKNAQDDGSINELEDGNIVNSGMLAADSAVAVTIVVGENTEYISSAVGSSFSSDVQQDKTSPKRCHQGKPCPPPRIS